MGPKPRDYSQKTPKKMKRLALYSALSDRALDDSVLVVDNWDFEQPKTKEARDALVAIGAKGKVLLVVDDVNVNARKSFRNLSNAHVISPMQLNVFDVLVSDVVVFTKENLLTSSTSDKTNENSSIPSNEEETEES